MSILSMMFLFKSCDAMGFYLLLHFCEDELI